MALIYIFKIKQASTFWSIMPEKISCIWIWECDNKSFVEVYDLYFEN